MQIKAILATGTLGLITCVSAAICHVESDISHRNTQACGSFSCLGSDNFYGSVKFMIDDELIVMKRDEFDHLTAGGGGVDIDERGQKFHIDPLGLIDHGDKPYCAARLGNGEVVNWGIQTTGTESGFGLSGTWQHCVHDWYCYP